MASSAEENDRGLFWFMFKRAYSRQVLAIPPDLSDDHAFIRNKNDVKGSFLVLGWHFLNKKSYFCILNKTK